MKTYYYIYRVGGDAPKIKHYTLEEAEKESLRLAKQHPESSFEILQCLGTTRMTAPSTFWMDGVIPPHVCNLNRAMNGECFICGERENENPEYRDLEEGEIIKAGDEFLYYDEWIKTGCDGDPYSKEHDDREICHAPHRRRIK